MTITIPAQRTVLERFPVGHPRGSWPADEYAAVQRDQGRDAHVVMDLGSDQFRLISFGYLHLPTGPDGSPILPAADRIEDVRDRLRDPAAARDIVDLDGHHPRVQDIVLSTPGARELLANLAGPRRIAIGCAGGKHRAAGITEILARELRARARGRRVEVEHLHAHLPRVLTTPADTRTAHPEQETAR